MSESFVGKARNFLESPELIEGLLPLELDESEPAAISEGAHQHRPELYALTAILSDEVIDQALSGRGQASRGLVHEDGRSVGEVRSYSQISQNLKTSLAVAVYAVVKKHEAAKTPFYMRLKSLCALFDLDEPGAHRYMSPMTLLISGTGTASIEVVSALSAVARIVKSAHPNPTLATIAEVARNSLGLINRVASVNIDHLDQASNLLFIAGKSNVERYAQVDVQALELKLGADGSCYVDFKAPVTQTQAPRLSNTIIGSIPTKFKTLGCPARAHLNGKSAIDKLWEWVIDIAEKDDIFMADDLNIF